MIIFTAALWRISSPRTWDHWKVSVARCSQWLDGWIRVTASSCFRSWSSRLSAPVQVIYVQHHPTRVTVFRLAVFMSRKWNGSTAISHKLRRIHNSIVSTVLAQNMSTQNASDSTGKSDQPIHRSSGQPQGQATGWLSEDCHASWVTPKGRDVLLHPLQGSDVVHEPIVPWKQCANWRFEDWIRESDDISNKRIWYEQSSHPDWIQSKGWDFLTEKIGMRQQCRHGDQQCVKVASLRKLD